MAYGDLDAHQEIGNALTSGPFWLVWWARIVLVGSFGDGPFFEDRLFIADILEHS
jgi:hypothetical protein